MHILCKADENLHFLIFFFNYEFFKEIYCQKYLKIVIVALPWAKSCKEELLKLYHSIHNPILNIITIRKPLQPTII